MNELSIIGTRLSGSWRNKQTDTVWQFAPITQGRDWYQLYIHASTPQTFTYQLALDPNHQQPVIRTQEDGDYLILKLTDKDLWLLKEQIAYSFEKHSPKLF